MTFKPGKDKTGGRKPGQPNKRTLDLVQVLKDSNYDPVADLIEYSELAKTNYQTADDPMEASNWVKIGVQCATGILPYVYPKRKPIEGGAQDLTPDQIQKLSDDDLVKHAQQMLNDLKVARQ